ncbi:MAG: tetratricopeptide repeat protein [Bacteroidaceae bacterium]|nr:tetratricopeptide repeat protein [Bacteroidaceae bacterium]
MRLLITLSAILFSAFVAIAQPKAVKDRLSSVAGVVTYSKGTVKANGTALFVEKNSELLASAALFAGADSAVVVDNSGKAYPVKYIVGVDDIFDCVKIRISPVKKVKPFILSSPKVAVGDELYMLAYGVKKNGKVEPVEVLAVDSVYSLAYYTLDKPMKEGYLSQPLLNSKGELVAVMQPAASGDTVKSYAVSAALSSSLVPSTRNYGKGFYDYAGMKIRTAMPDTKKEALSCMYMQAMMGDSLSWLNAIKDYMVAYPKSCEGYQSLAEYIAIFYRDMEQADKAWDKALSLAENKAEIYFGKAKVLNEIVLSGDSVSHSMLSFDNALEQIDKALSISRESLYINYKADMLYNMRQYDKAVLCYEELSATDMRGADVFAKISQCYVLQNDYDKAIAALDSAVACYGVNDKNVAPYILTRAVVKVSAEKYREAVLDLNRYEELMGGVTTADFYYMREQAELNCKMFQQALNDIETAIDLAPGNVLYYVEKGMLCYRVKLFDEGIRTMTKAAELAPEIAGTHYLLGMLYMQKGDNAKAKESLEKALSLGHADARVQLEKLEKQNP